MRNTFTSDKLFNSYLHILAIYVRVFTYFVGKKGEKGEKGESSKTEIAFVEKTALDLQKNISETLGNCKTN